MTRGTERAVGGDRSPPTAASRVATVAAVELIVNEQGRRRSVRLDLGRDRPGTLADLRRALGLAFRDEHAGRSLADLDLHRAMEFGDDPDALDCISRHLAAGWRPDRRGRFVVGRPPDRGPGTRPTGPDRPEAPIGPDPLPPIPWSIAVPGLIVAGVIGVVWSPLFAMIGAASSLAPLLRSLAPRILRRRTIRRHGEALAAHAAAVADVEGAWAEKMAEWLEERVLSPGTLDRGVESGTIRPWSRRLRAGEPLAVAVGRGRYRCRLEPDPGSPVGTGTTPMSTPEQDRVLVDVPLVIDLETGLAIGGDRADVLDLARWIVIETAFRHGPADLLATLVTTADRVVDWEWLRWIPSLRGVAVEPDEVVRLLEPLCSDGSGVTHLVLVDGVTPDGPGPLARVLAGRCRDVRVLWMGQRGDGPAACDRTVRVTADGFVRSGDPTEPEPLAGPASHAGWTWRLSADEAEEFGSFLAPFDDPEVDVGVVELPSVVPLDQLCSQVTAGHRVDVDRWDERWGAPSRIAF